VENRQRKRSSGKIRALVVDNNDLNQTGICNILENAGCTVEIVKHGHEGLYSLLHENFDVALFILEANNSIELAFATEAMKICPPFGVIAVINGTNEDALNCAKNVGLQSTLFEHFNLDFVEKILRGKARKKPFEVSTDTLAVNDFQLNHLREMTRIVRKSNSLLEFVREVSASSKILSSAGIVGIISVKGDSPVLILDIRKPIRPSCLTQISDYVRMKYQTFNSLTLPKNMEVRAEGVPCSKDGVKDMGSCVTVPLLINNEIHGLLVLALVPHKEKTASDISRLYQLVNHYFEMFTEFQTAKSLAIRDGLTGLYNWRYLQEGLVHVWEEGKRYQNPVGIVILDIDHFKMINDTYGHLVGDMVLEELAALLHTEARVSDITGRYGGDELMVILPRASREDVITLGNRLLQRVRSHVFCVKDHNFQITISVGASSSEGQEVKDISPSDILFQADQALYSGKNNGRDCICIWHSDLEAGEEFNNAHRETESWSSQRTILFDREKEVSKNSKSVTFYIPPLDKRRK